MKYRELFDFLSNMSGEQLDSMDVILFDNYENDWHHADAIYSTKELNNELSENHPVISF